MCACQVSLNVAIQVAAFLAFSVVTGRTTAERERMRKTAVSLTAFLVLHMCLSVYLKALVWYHQSCMNIKTTILLWAELKHHVIILRKL